MKTNTKTKLLILSVMIAIGGTGCATHTKPILLGGLLGGMIGAGVGYTVVHHGEGRKYEVPNTIITSAIFALGTMGALAWHYEAMDEQKIEITSRLTKPLLLKNNQDGADDSLSSSILQNEYNPSTDAIGRNSLSLDTGTRWVFPTFRRRDLKPEASGNEFMSSRYTWEVVRPGFFVNRDQSPQYFTKDDSEMSSSPKAKTPAKSSKKVKATPEPIVEPLSEPSPEESK